MSQKHHRRTSGHVARAPIFFLTRSSLLDSQSKQILCHTQLSYSTYCRFTGVRLGRTVAKRRFASESQSLIVPHRMLLGGRSRTRDREIVAGGRMQRGERYDGV
jgi:hypothetical protein